MFGKFSQVLLDFVSVFPLSPTQFFQFQVPRVSLVLLGCIANTPGPLLSSFPVPDLTLFLTLKPNLLTLDVFPQGPSVPKANNSDCSLNIHLVFHMHYLIEFSQLSIIIPIFRSGN